MKKLFTIAALALAFTINAQVIAFNPRTGDSNMDQILKDINTKAKNDIETFTKEVANKFGIIKTKVDQMVKIMTPGDVFMAAQTAEVTKKPIDDVTKAYEANKDKGWGAIAKDLGIKPGSPEFHALKNKMKEHGNSGKGKGNSGGHGKDDKPAKGNKGGGHGNGHGKGKGKE